MFYLIYWVMGTWVCVVLFSMPSFNIFWNISLTKMFGIILLVWNLLFVICWVIISEERGGEEDLRSDASLLQEERTRSWVPDLRSSSIFLISLQSWCCLPLPCPLLPCNFFPFIFGNSVASYNLPLPQLHQGVGVAEIQYPLVCGIVPESTLLFKNTICY